MPPLKNTLCGPARNTQSPVTILRVAHGGGSTRVASVVGGVVERVSRAPARLVTAGG